MERLTSNKEVSEMGMYELAHNSCYAKDRKARIRDFENDFDARELAIKLLEKFADIPNEFTDDEDFDNFMLDSLQYGTDNIQGLVAVFYQNLWAMADLRERLKKYEDTGITPEQIREIDRLYTEKCREFVEIQKNYLTGIELANIAVALKKLQEYQDLEEQGKLLKLPCAVGDTVWFIKSNFSYMQNPKAEKIRKVEIIDGEIIFRTENRCFEMKHIDKIVFLTREEAEVALKEL